MYEFDEADYCYGVGPIRFRLERVNWAQPIPHEGDTWFGVRGVVIDAAGRVGAVREMLVRASRIPAPLAVRRPRMRDLRRTSV